MSITERDIVHAAARLRAATFIQRDSIITGEGGVFLGSAEACVQLARELAAEVQRTEPATTGQSDPLGKISEYGLRVFAAEDRERRLREGLEHLLATRTLVAALELRALLESVK